MDGGIWMKKSMRKPITWSETPCKYPELTNCWSCTSDKPQSDGHLKRTVNKKTKSMGRIIYEQYFQCSILPKYVVRHKCDNPICVNPEHLLLGTQRDNNNDTKLRNRERKANGETHYKAKLTWNNVDFIRDNPQLSCVELSKLFGVADTVISRVRNFKIWKGEH